MANDDLNLNSLEYLLKDTSYDISILANFCAYLFEHLEHVNWVGFYINRNSKLFLGPFQGKPACIEIPFSKGVCGFCATSKQTIYVPDVSSFQGHIACDAASKSEVCIPILIHNRLFGVLDIDSTIVNRFTSSNINFLEQASNILVHYLEKIL